MNLRRNLSRGLVPAALLTLLATLSGCITSNDVLLHAAATPIRAGKDEVQYLVDGKWTKFGAGSLTPANGKYTWAVDGQTASFLNWNPKGSGIYLG